MTLFGVERNKKTSLRYDLWKFNFLLEHPFAILIMRFIQDAEISFIDYLEFWMSVLGFGAKFNFWHVKRDKSQAYIDNYQIG